MATHRTADLSTANTRFDGGAGRVTTVATAAAVVGLGLSAALVFFGSVDVGRFGKVWMHNFLFILSLALGGLFFVIIQHLARAGWSVAVRRVAEAMASNLRWMWLLFLPIVVLWMTGKLGAVYPWADIELIRTINPAEAHLVEAKTAYLNPTFFFIRAAIYFAVWFALGTYFWRLSVRQDSAVDAASAAATTSRFQRMSAPAIMLFGLTTTFAAFDWIMSLNPAWFSTIFGIYFFAGSCCGGFAAMIVILTLLRRQGKLEGIVTPEHFQDLGKLLFGFGIVFWAYIGYSQYMLIWYANLPETTGWFHARQLGGWKWVSVALIFGHFLVPFVLFISRHPKRIPATALFVAVWMLAIHWIDLYWLIMPEIPHDLGQMKSHAELIARHGETTTGLLDPLNWTTLLGMLGLFVAFTNQALRAHALIPIHDPRLHESLAFENM